MAEKSVDESKIMLRMSDFTSEPTRMLPPIKGYENQPIVTLEKSVEPLISLVPDVQQMVWTAKQNCREPKDSLTSDESASIMLYTLNWEPQQLSFYYILNATLRSEKRQELRPWFLYLRLVIYALAKLPSTLCPTIYRGVPIDMSKEFVKDKTFIWWSFSSCTSTIDAIKHFLGNKGHRTIINIECDSAKDISRHSFYQTENEILLYPARQFKVISCLDTGNQLHIIQLKEIQPQFPLIYIPQMTPIISPTIHMIPINNSYQNKKLKDFIDLCPHHSEIKLDVRNLTDDDMNIVVKEAIINKNCKILGLTSNKITPAGVSIIAKALSENTTLHELVLSYNDQVGDMGVYFLTEILSLNNSSLQKLILTSTGITDKGVGYLAEMLKKNSTLHSLNLNVNKIGDHGIKLLANTLTHYNSTLTHLYLSENKLLSDASVDFLIEMLNQNRSLSYLFISNCNLSEEGEERLRQTAQTKKGFYLQL
jgi:hypothetical protein